MLSVLLSTYTRGLPEAKQKVIKSALEKFPGVSLANTGNVPRGYLNYIFFDESFNFIAGNSNAKQLSITAASQFEPLNLEFTATSNGYLYVYVANESLTDVNVFFDDFKVTVKEGPVSVQRRVDYYPFGLPMRREGTLSYKFGYQGQFAQDETEDENLGWSSFQLRNYDAKIGRWLSMDPEGQFNSPYVGMGNNPINGIDPDGAWVEGAGFWNNLFKSDSRIHAERIAASWSSENTNYYAYKAGESWGVLSLDDWSLDANFNNREQYSSFTPVNSDGSLGEITGGFDSWSPSPGNIDYDPLGQLTFAPGIGQVVGIPTRAVLGFTGRLTVTVAGRYVLNQSVRNFTAFMTPRELFRFGVTSRVGVKAMMRGKGIDAAFRYYASKNLILGAASKFGYIRMGARNFGADMVGGRGWSGYWWDVTTRGAWNSHVLKYGVRGTGFIYK